MFSVRSTSSEKRSMNPWALEMSGDSENWSGALHHWFLALIGVA
ncbi:MAG: hypothetical protein ACK56F_33235 [bacterium]